MESVTHEADGTFTVYDEFFEMKEPIRGVPTKEMALEIVSALYKAECAGCHHYAESEY